MLAIFGEIMLCYSVEDFSPLHSHHMVWELSSPDHDGGGDSTYYHQEMAKYLHGWENHITWFLLVQMMIRSCS